MTDELWTQIKYEGWPGGSDWYFQGASWPYYDSGCLASRRDHSNQIQGHAILTAYPCLPNIKIENNVKFHQNASEMHYDYFRAQAYPPPGYYYPNNCYFLRFYPSGVQFGYVVAGAATTLVYHWFSPILSLMTFYKYRFTLWKVNATTDGYKFELWETEHWTTYLEGIYYANWQDAALNYYGTFLHSGNQYDEFGAWIDDLYIYIKGGGGFIWIEGTNFAYTDSVVKKRLREGVLTGITGKTPGYISVDGDYFVYVDSTGAVRRIQGTLTSLTGKIAGQSSINLAQGGTKYCYIDGSGNERCFEGT
jgi:hypothetical protein